MQEIAFALLNSDLFSVTSLRFFCPSKRYNSSYERNKTGSKILRHLSSLHFSVKHEALMNCGVETTSFG